MVGSKLAVSWLLFQGPLGGNSAFAQQCGLYLAPSTIPGAGLGMFSGVNHKTGDEVMAGDIVIPEVELKWNNEYRDFFWLWKDYSWTARAFPGMEDEGMDGADWVEGHSPGIGAAINGYLSLVNIEESIIDLNNAGLHRIKDPGAGAFTPYHNRKGLAIEDIKAGQELYVWYGEEYFAHRTGVYGYMPFDRDYKQADKILEKYLVIKWKHLSEAAAEDLWSRVLGIKDDIQISEPSRVMVALPSNYTALEAIAQVGTSRQDFNRSRVDLEWLEANGKCADNIRPGISNIPQAGRGAFATRFIPQGGLVAPAPLIHVPNRTLLQMYGDLSVFDDGRERVLPDIQRGPVHQQLILNYCFGHRQSSLLLDPYGSWTSLINHSREPNSRIMWAEDLMSNPEWRDLSPDELEKQSHAGLVFDFIALRDIQEGEEITIDYGDEWQAAWDEHVRHWKPPKNADTYEAAYELNNDVDLVLRTVHEAPYSDHLRLYVHHIYRGMSGLRNSNDEWYRALILDRFVVNGETRYMAQLYLPGEDVEKGIDIQLNREIQFSVPRDAFIFDDLPYSRDHAQRSAFRHDIRVPDDMWPGAWKDLEDR